MDFTELVTVAVVDSRIEAELIAGLLRSNGIKTGVNADDAGAQEPALQLQGVQVLVATQDAEEARKILAAR
ncbi:putative signal transducing protein [Actinoplanes sp. CA-142083]|uniref:putative signal transducing protein n=1 Tax=Actinoplanes sp. CA-142083 TaxID=3239903 RepID=UPI003D8F9CA4